MGCGEPAAYCFGGHTVLFFEWLFFVTSPSPVGSLPILSQFKVLLESPVRLTPSLLVIQAAASLLSSFRYPRVRWIALVPAACLLGVLAMILLDNFTYTLFGIGILTTGEGLRALYIGILAALIVFAWQQLSKWFSAIFVRRGVAEGALSYRRCSCVPQYPPP